MVRPGFPLARSARAGRVGSSMSQLCGVTNAVSPESRASLLKCNSPTDYAILLPAMAAV